jgi:hypothetical protein
VTVPRRALALASAILMTVGLVAAATPAQAAVTLGTCTGKGTVSITPGLTLFTPRIATLKFFGKVTGCTGRLPASGKLSGSATADAPGITCRSGSASGRIRITWVDGTIDVIKATADSNAGFSGKVVKGPHLGAVIALAGTGKPVTGDCVFTPLTKVSFSGTATATK